MRSLANIRVLFIVCLNLRVTTVTSCGSKSSKMDVTQPVITSSLSCKPDYPPDERVICTFHLHNNGPDDITFLKWLTPYEGMRSSCLQVKHNGKAVSYDGILVKRGNPGPEQYIPVAARTTVSKDFDLSDGYSIMAIGTYSVAVDVYLLEYYVQGKSERKTIPLKSDPVQFNISIRGKNRKTTGQKMRSG